MCCANNIFSLFGSVRRARAASAASSAASGFTAWRASSRLRKSSGVFRNEGSSFFFWLILPPYAVATPSTPAKSDRSLLTTHTSCDRRRTGSAQSPVHGPREPAQPLAVREQLRHHLLPPAFVGR